MWSAYYDWQCRGPLKGKLSQSILLVLKLDVDIDFRQDKFALLWGEAQKKIAYSYLKVT